MAGWKMAAPLAFTAERRLSHAIAAGRIDAIMVNVCRRRRHTGDDTWSDDDDINERRQ